MQQVSVDLSRAVDQPSVLGSALDLSYWQDTGFSPSAVWIRHKPVIKADGGFLCTSYLVPESCVDELKIVDHATALSKSDTTRCHLTVANVIKLKNQLNTWSDLGALCWYSGLMSCP